MCVDTYNAKFIRANVGPALFQLARCPANIGPTKVIS